MKLKFTLAAMLTVAALGFGMGSASAAETAANPQQAYAEFDAKMRPIMDQMHQKRSELAGIFNSAAPADQAKVQSLYREIADLQAQAFSVRQEFAQTMEQNGQYYGGYHHGGGMGMGMGMGMGGHGGMGYGHRGGGRGNWGGGHHGGNW